MTLLYAGPKTILRRRSKRYREKHVGVLDRPRPREPETEPQTDKQDRKSRRNRDYRQTGDCW